MKFKPSAINNLLATLPENLQILALQTIKEEYDRLERGDFTENEKKMFQLVIELGANAAKTINQIALKCINHDYNH